VFFGFAHALDVDLLCLSELTTVLALGYRTALLLDLKKRAICMFAGRGTMALDTGFTIGRSGMRKRENTGGWIGEM